MASVSKQYNVHLLEKLLFVKFPLQVQYSVRKLASPKGEKNYELGQCISGKGRLERRV